MMKDDKDDDDDYHIVKSSKNKKIFRFHDNFLELNSKRRIFSFFLSFAKSRIHYSLIEYDEFPGI